MSAAAKKCKGPCGTDPCCCLPSEREDVSCVDCDDGAFLLCGDGQPRCAMCSLARDYQQVSQQPSVQQ